jgi:hypothetical protein
MKTNLKLQSIDKTGSGVEFVNLILTLEYKSDYSETLTVKLRGGGHNLRIMSDHLVHDMAFVIKWLDENSKDDTNLRTNYSEVVLFAKEMQKANKRLNETIIL